MEILHGVTENRFSSSKKKVLACCHLGKFLNYFCFICYIKLQFHAFSFILFWKQFFGFFFVIDIVQKYAKTLRIH